MSDGIGCPNSGGVLGAGHGRDLCPEPGDLGAQRRRLAVGLAGQEQNWPYAAYELGNLRGAFNRTAQAWPTYRTTDMADLIPATTKAPMDAVAAAIKATDPQQFNEAYEQLTETCNACHQSTDNSLVVIRVPKRSPFPDQDFRPVKP